ncbi:MAG: hypothetical protein WCW66_00480 [Patescibacteria group bacterium]
MINPKESAMKKRTFISTLVVLAATFALSGCSTHMWRNFEGVYNIHTETNFGSKELKLMALRYTDENGHVMFSEIGYSKPEKPKKPFKLRYTESLMRVQVGKHDEFLSKVMLVEVWVDDFGPIVAEQGRDGYFYFRIRTDNPWLVGLDNARFTNLAPGMHLVTVEVTWGQTYGPHYRGPLIEDSKQTVYGLLEFDPWYIIR